MRLRGSGCPICPKRRATKQNNLKKKNPRLARQWHPTKNKELLPQDVTPGTDEKVWWVCGKGHEWEATVRSRNRGTGCPCCAGKKADDDNCLETLAPKVAREWHPSKNGKLTPRDVTLASAKKVWWKCAKGHAWQSTIGNRTNGNGCPGCYKELKQSHNLRTVNPKLVREWHPKKNKGLKPKDVTCGSGKKVWWLCQKGHEWEARISERHRGSGCPVCGRKKVRRGRDKKVVGA
jgi:hypothetical protein